MENQESVITQADIEDVAIYAAARGLTVLKLGMTAEDMAAYNRAAFAKTRIVFENGGVKSYDTHSGAELDPIKVTASHPIELVVIEG